MNDNLRVLDVFASTGFFNCILFTNIKNKMIKRNHVILFYSLHSTKCPSVFCKSMFIVP